MESTDKTRRKLQLQHIDEARGPVIGMASDSDEALLSWHSHSRDQFWHALSGLVHVVTRTGHWLVPPDYALWIPAGCEHSVELLGAVKMRSLYFQPGMIGWPSERPRLLSVNGFTKALVLESMETEKFEIESRRRRLILELLLLEIEGLQEAALALPLPSEPRMLRLCKVFLTNPDVRLRLDGWADACKMSRRSFSRHFREQTGLSVDEWRQHACVFLALPRILRGEPVTTIAFDLGYQSSAAFSTMFTRLIGRNPTAMLQNRH